MSILFWYRTPRDKQVFHFCLRFETLWKDGFLGHHTEGADHMMRFCAHTALLCALFILPSCGSHALRSEPSPALPAGGLCRCLEPVGSWTGITVDAPGGPTVELLIDGEAVEPDNGADFSLPPGLHQVEISLEGVDTPLVDREISVTPLCVHQFDLSSEPVAVSLRARPKALRVEAFRFGRQTKP